MRRFSIARLMGAVTLAGAGFALLRMSSTQIRTSAIFSLVLFILLMVTAASIVHRRPFRVGFCVSGWGWLLMTIASLVIAPWNSTADRIPVPMPIPTLALMELHGRAFVAGNLSEPMAVIPNFNGGHSLVSYLLVQDCNSISILVVACVGGLITWILRPSDAT